MWNDRPSTVPMAVSVLQPLLYRGYSVAAGPLHTHPPPWEAPNSSHAGRGSRRNTAVCLPVPSCAPEAGSEIWKGD